VTVLRNEIAPIPYGLANDELRQRAEVWVTVVRYEICWRDNPPGRMPDTDERLSATEADRAYVDLRLVPQFELACG
jgi:hypothetical protein